MIICLQRGAGLHMAQMTPLLLTVSFFSKIQIGFTFPLPAHLGSPGKMAVKRGVCVCVRVQFIQNVNGDGSKTAKNHWKGWYYLPWKSTWCWVISPWWSVKGCGLCGGSKIAISHWQSQSPLTQRWCYRAARDIFRSVVDESVKAEALKFSLKICTSWKVM